MPSLPGLHAALKAHAQRTGPQPHLRGWSNCSSVATKAWPASPERSQPRRSQFAIVLKQGLLAAPGAPSRRVLLGTVTPVFASKASDVERVGERPTRSDQRQDAVRRRAEGRSVPRPRAAGQRARRRRSRSPLTSRAEGATPGCAGRSPTTKLEVLRPGQAGVTARRERGRPRSGYDRWLGLGEGDRYSRGSVRICSLLPSATEIVAVLGLADRLAGEKLKRHATTHTDTPPSRASTSAKRPDNPSLALRCVCIRALLRPTSSQTHSLRTGPDGLSPVHNLCGRVS